MIEIPESSTIGRQADSLLSGRIIHEVILATSPHRFAFYNDDPEKYPTLLAGRTIISAQGHGAFIDIHLDKDTHFTVGDGTNLRYYPATESHPVKHQLLIVLDDRSFLACAVAMYGSIYAYRGTLDNFYHQVSIRKVSPLDENFDRLYFENLIRSTQKDISVKALLATEQRIPGLGNGVLQDILFCAGIHPKRKISMLSDLEKDDLFHCVKVLLAKMSEQGGRDTEKDLWGCPGGYASILNKNTYKKPCPTCGDSIVKEAYLGGAVYYCPTCQKLK